MLSRNDIIHELFKIGFRSSDDLLVCKSNNKKIEEAYAISIVRMLNKKYNLPEAVEVLCESMDKSDEKYFSWMNKKLPLVKFDREPDKT